MTYEVTLTFSKISWFYFKLCVLNINFEFIVPTERIFFQSKLNLTWKIAALVDFSTF